MIGASMFQLSERQVPCREGNHEDTEHMEITQRFRKTLYFGKTPRIERPSLPLTELAVEFCQDAAQRELGRVDTYVAASMGRQACMSPCSMVLGMVYIERLKKKNPNFLRKVSSSDLFLISMMMASKFEYDEGVDEEVFNDEWAESANMDVDDVNTLEMDFLTAMDWGLFVRPDEFQSALLAIEKRIALTQGSDRNWFSYTDLWVLFQDPKYQHLWQEIRKELGQVFFACSFAYLASVLTIVGSVVALSYVTAGISMVTPLLSKIHTPTLRDLSIPQRGFLPSLDENVITAGGILSEKEFNTSDLPDDFPASECSTRVHADHNVVSVPNSHIEGQDNATNHRAKPHIQSVLPPLLAVMTLRNTLINFVSAVSSTDSQREDNSLMEAKLSPLDCAEGTCLVNADRKTACWNMSIPRHMNSESNHISRKHNAKSCCGHCRRMLTSNSNTGHKLQISCRTSLVLGSAKSTLAEFRCCCQSLSASHFEDPWKLQTDPFPDITENLGFHTRTRAPFVAVT